MTNFQKGQIQRWEMQAGGLYVPSPKQSYGPEMQGLGKGGGPPAAAGAHKLT